MDLGKFDRILEQQKPYIFKNSKYLVRDPIGKMEIIRNFKGKLIQILKFISSKNKILPNYTDV